MVMLSPTLSHDAGFRRRLRRVARVMPRQDDRFGRTLAGKQLGQERHEFVRVDDLIGGGENTSSPTSSPSSRAAATASASPSFTPLARRQPAVRPRHRTRPGPETHEQQPVGAVDDEDTGGAAHVRHTPTLAEGVRRW